MEAASPPPSPALAGTFQQQQQQQQQQHQHQHHQPSHHRPDLAAAMSPSAGGPTGPRPLSSLTRNQRSSSRISVGSRPGDSRASDEDARTAVKVAIRVRPPLQAGEPGHDLVPQRFRASVCHVAAPTNVVVESAQGKRLFVFDQVFAQDVDQDGVWAYLSESISSFVQGYNVSILAYGQSGAGKSYTMGTTGPREQVDPQLMGVVPRAAAALFEKLTGVSQNGRMAGSGLRTPSRYSLHGAPQAPPPPSKIMSENKSWQMKATYVEIYNEQLRDLLLPESVPAHERAQVTIREDPKGRIHLTGLRQVAINSVEDLLNALNFGSSIRQTDATAINAKSSRSHAVFSINLIQKKSKSTPTSAPTITPTQEKRFSVPIEAMASAESWVTVDSKLNFVDLAGSERLKNTGSHGERAKEGISINAGLASLGKVIAQLSSRSPGSHVSYRDSRLTRLLQDSLGGIAITYMIACINPAEFHLSETLNTVQYAQRARAIQSKPKIQQVSDDSDRQAVIDRLRAEVSFLRDQIRLTERTSRKNNAPQERAERQHEKEIELQNQLLDMQENYGTLSQRHAKLISDIARTRGGEQGTDMGRDVLGGDVAPTLKDAMGDSAFERLKRSNTFAEAVKQVVIEYEKTIQSLESSLSKTRSTLSTSESTLMERETRVAYMETVTQQLQHRLQKSADREANSEGYLRQLEARVEAVSGGEERTAGMVHELRKELTRVRENESSCEDYISTLEERLAEAEQDLEILQREIDRLEGVVERQRSVGKMDSMLQDLNSARSARAEGTTHQPPLTNGHVASSDDVGEHQDEADSTTITPREEKDLVQTSHPSAANGTGKNDGTFFDTDDEADAASLSVRSQRSLERQTTDGANGSTARPNLLHADNASRTTAGGDNGSSITDAIDFPQSPAQSKFVSDKLETVTQELFDLRMEHDSTINDYDDLGRKYQIALNTLAELQDAVDDARSLPAANEEAVSPSSTRPTSFLGEGEVEGMPRAIGGQTSSSRMLSSELSSVGESAAAMQSDYSEDQALGATYSSSFTSVRPTSTTLTNNSTTSMMTATADEPVDQDRQRIREKRLDTNTFAEKEKLAAEVDSMRKLSAEKEQVVEQLTASYAELEEKHHETLDHMERLKAEVHKTRAAQSSPGPGSQALRRKSSQTMITIDRANRSAASLRNIGLEHFEDTPDVHQNFELHLNGLMTELQLRSERVQTLESEVMSVRKQMESKMTIITGLARERSSLKSTAPLDISFVSSMRDQLVESERKLKVLQEQHVVREDELEKQVQSLRSQFALQPQKPEHNFSMPGLFPSTPAAEVDGQRSQPGQPQQQRNGQMDQLRREIAEWKERHQVALSKSEQSEKQQRTTIEQLSRQLQATEHSTPSTLTTSSAPAASTKDTERGLAEDDFSVAGSEPELVKYQEVIESLEKEVEAHRADAIAKKAQLHELEQAHSALLQTREDDQAARAVTESELISHRERVAGLEDQIGAHTRTLDERQTELESLQSAHAREPDALARIAADAESSAREREQTDAVSSLRQEMERRQDEHETARSALNDEVAAARSELSQLLAVASGALGKETDSSSLDEHIRGLANERKSLLSQQDTALTDLQAARAALQRASEEATALQGRVAELSTINEETLKELERVSEKEKKSSRLVEQLEDQLNSNFEQQQAANNRYSALQSERQGHLEDLVQAKAGLERELEDTRNRVVQLETGRDINALMEGKDGLGLQRSESAASSVRMGNSTQHSSLPSPPPAIPLPPLPGSPTLTLGGAAGGSASGGSTGPGSGAASSGPAGMSQTASRHQSKELLQTSQVMEEQEARLRTIEKSLYAEKQLTGMLEEAVTDLEAVSSKARADAEAWRGKYSALEEQMEALRKERNNSSRYSLQAVEEERSARMQAEAARAQLEQRMAALSQAQKGVNGKKKKNALNCF